MRYSATGYIAVRQPVFVKIETQNKSGFAFNGNRSSLVQTGVVFAYDDGRMSLLPGDRVMLHGDAGLQPWAKQVMLLGDEEFVLCPVNTIIGYEKAEPIDGNKP